MTNQSERFFSTYGDWNPEAFFAIDLMEPAIFICMLVRCREPGERSRIAIGESTRSLWNAMRSEFPSIHGHRGGWGELLFFLSGVEVNSTLEGSLRVTSQIRNPNCEVTAAAISVPTEKARRLVAVDNLLISTGKVDYREDIPGTWCIRNNRILKSAG